MTAISGLDGVGPAFRGIEDARLHRVIVRHAIMENYFQQRLVHFNVAVVFDKPKPVESIHEEADARTRCPNHFCKRLLRDRRNLRFRFARLTIFSHQQKDSCQTLLAGIEELIDKVGLAPHASRQQELYK